MVREPQHVSDPCIAKHSAPEQNTNLVTGDVYMYIFFINGNKMYGNSTVMVM